MNLIFIDIGNTYTKIKENQLITSIRTNDLNSEFIKKYKNKKIILSSVVLEKNILFKGNKNLLFTINQDIVDSNDFSIDNLNELGSDLISAFYLFKDKKNCNLTIFGTMIVTLKIRNFKLVSVNLIQGIDLYLKSISDNISLIKELDYKNIKSKYYTNTQDSISGNLTSIYQNYLNKLKKDRIKNYYQIYDSDLIEFPKKFIKVDNVVLKGMEEIYKNFAKKKEF